ncbi:hypothetical protein R5R35_002706 [Gryllus longicercus]|uniref:K Homology domain-containing protein n=1 Tax=Gryllus longicercus TaxID=2509291 RepID=A0AAN9W252_9ORTH
MASVGGDLGASNGGASADTVPAGDEKTDMDMEAEGSGAGKAGDYVRELLNEKQSLDPSQWPNATRLLDQEVTKEVARIQSGGKPTARDSKYVDIYREKPIRVAVKVLVPIKEHPKFNFVGKLLGPKGNSMKRLQEDTMTKMAVLGRGSMKDKQKEEELRLSMDPKYAHLSDDLHVEIAAFAPPAEAHARIAYALAEVRKYLIPDSNDEIRQEQMREMELLIQTVPGGGGGAAGGAGGGGGGDGVRLRGRRGRGRGRRALHLLRVGALRLVRRRHRVPSHGASLRGLRRLRRLGRRLLRLARRVRRRRRRGQPMEGLQVCSERGCGALPLSRRALHAPFQVTAFSLLSMPPSPSPSRACAPSLAPGPWLSPTPTPSPSLADGGPLALHRRPRDRAAPRSPRATRWARIQGEDR